MYIRDVMVIGGADMYTYLMEILGLGIASARSACRDDCAAAAFTPAKSVLRNNQERMLSRLRISASVK
jgi:hypothetical protein